MARAGSTVGRALVTGASAGLGAEFARQLATAGSDLVLVARREQRLRALADELATAHGVDVEVLAADLADRQQLTRVEERLRDLDRPVDLLVNNAGFGAYGDFAELPLDEQQSMLDVNVTALVRLSHAAATTMRGRGGGILNVASTAAFQPNPYGAVYGATKSLVWNLSEALHVELAAEGVRVTMLAPGVTATEFQAVAGIDEGRLPDLAIMRPEEVVRAGLRAVARGRVSCVPGAGNRIASWGSRLSPTAVTRWFSARVHGYWARG